MMQQMSDRMNDHCDEAMKYDIMSNKNNDSSSSTHYNDNTMHHCNSSNNITVKRLQKNNRPQLRIRTGSCSSIMSTSTAVTTITQTPSFDIEESISSSSTTPKIEFSTLQSLKSLIGNSSRRMKKNQVTVLPIDHSNTKQQYIDAESKIIITDVVKLNINQQKKDKKSSRNLFLTKSTSSSKSSNNNSSFIMNYTQRFSALRGKSVILTKDSMGSLLSNESCYSTTCSMIDHNICFTVSHDISSDHFVISANIRFENDNDTNAQISILEDRVKVLEEQLKSHMKKCTSNVSLLYAKSSNDIIFRLATNTMTSDNKVDVVSKSQRQLQQRQQQKTSKRLLLQYQLQFDEFCILFNNFIQTSIHIRFNLYEIIER